MERLADHLDSVAAAVAEAAHALARATPDAYPFAGHAGGLPSRTGLALHGRVAGALAAHARDASHLAERAAAAAESVRAAQSRYEETDDAVRQRMRRLL